MGWLGKLLRGGGVSDAVVAVTDGVRSIKNTFSSKLDPASQADFDKALNDLQASVNREEAKHPSMFVAGWRPAVGWVCALSLFYHFIVAQILGAWVELPTVDIGALWPIITGMLGLGGARTYEKLKKVEHLR